jgi:histidine triad (HIT) family protein
MDCLFCDIVAGRIPSTKQYEDDLVLAFADIHPSAPTHILVIPKEHIVDLSHTKNSELLGHIQLVAAQIADEKGVAAGYKIVLNGGKYQDIKHLHYHLLGGSDL